MSLLSRKRVFQGYGARSGATGFTLLEAIVALTVIGLTLIPIVSFISISIDQLLKAAEANDRSFVMQNAIAMMDPVNPTVDGRGSLPLNDDVLIAWDSKALIPPDSIDIASNTGLPTRHLAFYNVHVTVSRSGEPWFDFDMRKVGYVDATPFGAPSSNMQ